MSRTLALAAIATVALALTGCQTDNTAGLRTAGDNAMIRHDYEAAHQNYAQCVELKPGDASASHALGRSLLALNRPAEAADHLRIASMQEPRNDKFLDDLCEALFAAKRTDELARLLRSNAIDANAPNAVANYVRYGVYSMKMGDADTAKTALLTAARIDQGKTIEPQLALHDFYKSIGQEAAAEERLRMAAFIDSRDARVRQRAASSGAVVGPTFAVQPTEQREP